MSFISKICCCMCFSSKPSDKIKTLHENVSLCKIVLQKNKGVILNKKCDSDGQKKFTNFNENMDRFHLEIEKVASIKNSLEFDGEYEKLSCRIQECDKTIKTHIFSCNAFLKTSVRSQVIAKITAEIPVSESTYVNKDGIRITKQTFKDGSIKEYRNGVLVT